MQQLAGEVEQQDGDDRRQIEAAHRREDPPDRLQDRVCDPDDQPDQRVPIIDRGDPREEDPDHDQNREELEYAIHQDDEVHHEIIVA